MNSINMTYHGRYTIIDEADEMVSADWVDDMRKIMTGGGEQMHLHLAVPTNMTLRQQ